jgi:hypothetical protein
MIEKKVNIPKVTSFYKKLLSLVSFTLVLMPSETYESSGCRVRYDRNNLEIKMWILSLIFMSWTLMNLTNKVKEGHCLTINHQHGDQNPRKCFDGRKFHYSIYQKCIKSFYESLAVIEKDLAEYRLH